MMLEVVDRESGRETQYQRVERYVRSTADQLETRMGRELEIVETKRGEVVVLAPDGSVSTAADCSKLERCLSRLVGTGEHHIVVDFGRVRRISARTLRAFLLTKRRLAPVNGALVLCNLSEKVRDTFAIGGFDRDFTIVGTRGEGVDRAGASQTLAAPETTAAGEDPPWGERETGRAFAGSALDPGLAALLPRLGAALGLGDSPEAVVSEDAAIPAETLEAVASRTLEALSAPQATR